MNMFRLPALSILIALIATLTIEPSPAAEVDLDRARQIVDATAPSPEGRISEKVTVPLIRMLGHAEWAQREAATLELIALGKKVELQIMPLTLDSDPELRMRARRILEEIPPPRPPPSAEELSEAIMALARAGDPVIPERLFPMLSHADESIRQCAVMSLRRLSRESFGFKADDPEAEREAAAARWRSWGEAQGADFRYDAAGESAVVVCDSDNQQVMAIDLDGTVLWRRHFNAKPGVASVRKNGNLLLGFRDSGGVIEVSPAAKIVWRLPSEEKLLGVVDLQEMANGNLLLTDDEGGKVVEMTREGEVVWRLAGLDHPHSAFRTSRGSTVIAVHKADEVIEVDQAGEILRRIPDQQGVSDAVPAPQGKGLVVTRMGLNPKVALLDWEGAVSPLYVSGWPITSAVLTPEGVFISANRERGIVSDIQSGKLRPLGVSRDSLWGKIRRVSRERVVKATPVSSKVDR